MRGGCGAGDARTFPSLHSTASAPSRSSPSCLILVTSSWPGPLQSVPSPPRCQSDLLTVKIWPVLSQLETLLSRGVHPLECQTQIQPDCKSLSDLAGTQEKERKGEMEGRVCGLTSLAKIKQWTQKAGQDQTFIIHPIEEAFCNSNVFIYIHSTSFWANGGDSGSYWSFEALL